MFDPKERITFSISTGELERRWALAREVMRERKIDYLLMRNDERFFGGYVRWFTDVPARASYPFTVIFPRDEEMTLIMVGPVPPGEPAPPAWNVRGVKKRLNAPYFPVAHYTHTYDAELAVSVLKEKKNAVIGLVGKSFIPVNFHEYLVKHLPGATFTDMTEEIDHFKAIKSAEEITVTKKTAALQDVAMQQARNIIRPGLRDADVYVEVLSSVVKQGSEQQLIACASAPKGVPAGFQPFHLQNRTIREGDQVSLLIEVCGPGGFYTEMARIFSVGKPSQELVDGFGCALEIQARLLNMIKSKASIKEMMAVNNEMLAKKGYKPELRLNTHGQGYDLVERPLFLDDETMTIQAGMNLTVHPIVATNALWCMICDNYIIGPDGPGECIHKTPKEIIVVT